MLSPRSRQAGFSIIELIVAIGAMGLVVGYALLTFTYNRNAYVVIDDVSEAHQNSIAIASLIERDIRNAGYMVPAALAACGIDSTTGPDMLFLSDSDAIRAPEDLPVELAGTPLSIDLNGSPPAWSNGSNAIDLKDLQMDKQASYGANGDFRVQAGVIFADLDNPTQVFCGVVTAIDNATNQITVDLSDYTAAASGPPAGGSDWAFVPAHVYRIQGETLMRNDKVMAQNVEDLQLAWFYDVQTENNQMDANENFGSAAGPDLDDAGWGTISNANRLREIRFNLAVKTSQDDPNDLTIGRPQDLENHVYALPVTPDGFRRRIHTATIRLRNIASAS